MKRDLIYGLLKFIVIISIIVVAVTCKKKDNLPVTEAPLAITNPAAWPGPNWILLQGQANGQGLLTTVTFDYDTTINYTHTLSPSPDTTTGNSYVSFSATLANLTPKTKYHYRIRSVNKDGEVKGTDVTFTTTDTIRITINFNPGVQYDSIYDQDGNKYRTVQIGTQTWTAENIKSTRYNDGTPIPFVLDLTAWSSLTTPGYCWYNNDSTGYGAMYNWYAVGTGKLCPEGWHVPTDDEWTILTDYLGGNIIAGASLKEAGSSHWYNQTAGVTNESGFTGLPAGYRTYGGTFKDIGKSGYWWTSNESSTAAAWYRRLFYSYNVVDRSNASKNSGSTVRCLKD